jgi:hypothetical protein
MAQDRDTRRARERVIRSATLEELARLPDTTPADLKRGLILPLPQGALPVEGTVGLPQVTQTFEVSSSGLAVPTRPPRSFADAAISYLSLREDFDVDSTEEQIIDDLRPLPLRQVLWILAQITHKADKAMGNPEGQAKLCEILPPELIPRARGLVSSPARAIVSPQVSLALALRALVHCSGENEATEEDFGRLIRHLGLLILALGDHIAPPRGPDHLALQVARTELFFKLWGHTQWYEASHELLFKTLPSLRDRSDWIDVGDVVRAAYGLSLEDFWAITVAMGIASFGNDDPLRFPIRFRDGLGDEVMEQWEAAWTIDLAEARLLAEADLASGSSWLFSPFVDRPILDAGGGLRFTPRSHFLAEKGGLTGMFWAVSRALKRTGGSHVAWATLFGHAVEAQARKAVTDHVGDPARLLNEDQLRDRWGAGQLFDLLAVYPDAWVAFEFRHRIVSRQARAEGDLGHLHRELELAAIGKFGQIDAALQRGLAAEPSIPPRILPVVVLGAHFPTNPHTARTIAAEVAANSAVLQKDSRCRRPAVLDLFELHNAIDVARETGRLLPDVLEDWLSATDGEIGFWVWLASDGPGIRPSPRREWVTGAIARVFGREGHARDSGGG